MPDIYRVELTWSGVTITGDAPSPTVGLVPRHYIWLMAKNSEVGFQAATNKAWAIYGGVNIGDDGSGGFEYRAFFQVFFWHELFSTPDDFVILWNHANDPSGNPLIQNQAMGNNGSALFSGGNLEIEKDEAAGFMHFVTPLGTMTALLSDPTNPAFGNLDFDEQNALPIHFLGHGHAFLRPNRVFTMTPSSTQVDWHDAIDRKNGLITQQIPMSSGVGAGSWFPTEERGVYPFEEIAGYTGSNPFTMVNASSQEATVYRMKTTWQPSDDPPGVVGRSTYTARWRLLSMGGTGQNFRDMTHAAEHGPIWATYVLPTDISKVKLRTTFDNFHSSVVTDAYDNAMSANESPNINWYDDRLWLVWYDGTAVKQSFSQDWGTNWSTAVDLMLSGTNPSHLVDAQSGLSYYFYIDSFQSLVLRRSGDFGKSFVDAAAITVQTNVGLQTVAAEFTSSGEVVVGWIDAMSGDWVQLRSQDRGLSWL